MRIAVIDDEEIVRKRLKQTLEKEGHRLETFPSGESFLGLLDKAHFDLVFLDVVLPGLGGMEILRLIKGRAPEFLHISTFPSRLPLIYSIVKQAEEKRPVLLQLFC